jgi:hypothetical protein
MPNNDEIDLMVDSAQPVRSLLLARDSIQAATLGGKAGSRAAAGKLALKKAAVPLEVGLMGVEALRLATDEDVRLKRVQEAEELAKEDNAAFRMLAAQSNPIGTIYGAGEAIYQTARINASQEQADKDYESEKQRVEEKIRNREMSRMVNEIKGFDPFNNRVNVDPARTKQEDDKAIGLELVRSYFGNNGTLS